MEQDGPLLDRAEALRLARAMSDLLHDTRHQLVSGTSLLVTRVTEHIGAALADIPNIALSLQAWEHVSLHEAVSAYLAAYSPDAQWFGVAGANRSHEDLMDMLGGADLHGMYRPGAVDYTSLAAGPDRVVDAIQLGFVPTAAPNGCPVVIGVRGGLAEHGLPACELRVLAADRETATAVRDEVEALMRAHDVLRGQVLSFDVNEHRGNRMLSFMPRPQLGRADVVLPDGVLDVIEQHVVRSPAQTARLVELGQHLKRGLLLYGPPGTGKTHTMRYLISRLCESTVIVISGRAMKMIAEAAALARRLAPSVLVIEDVDLIAEDRSAHEASPLLFELLNRIDGVDADVDVTFVLTTNRVEHMEKALVDRPGRVDLAIEVPKPDDLGRERLLRLYARDLPLRLAPDSAVITRTAGVTASFMRELVRRAVLRALAADPAEPVVLDEELLIASLDELSGERAVLTRALLGG